ncbi:MAG: hypothetical protein ACRCX1_05445 [Bacteroidales bacterium]
MKKPRKYLFISLFFLLLTSCSMTTYSWYTLSDKSMRVSTGMTKDLVLKAIGDPDLRSFNNDKEQWEYRQLVGAYAAIDCMIIYFENGKVVSMESFSKPKYPDLCPPGVVITPAQVDTQKTGTK